VQKSLVIELRKAANHSAVELGWRERWLSGHVRAIVLAVKPQTPQRQADILPFENVLGLRQFPAEFRN
jgi:hypothetical protein